MYATSDQTTETVMEKLTNNWIPSYGVPKRIITDRGLAFNSKLMKDLAQRYSVKLAKTSAYHPQSNGKIERMHRNLGTYLRMYMENNAQWEKCLPGFVFAHNTGEKDRERYSPAFLVYGRDLRHSGQHMDSKVMYHHQEDMVAELISNIKKAMEVIKESRVRVRAKIEELQPLSKG